MKHPITYAGTYPNAWDGYVFKEPLGYTSGRHTGVDYNGPGAGNADLGQPITAIVGGTVVAHVNNGQVGGFGNALIIQTDGCPPNTAGSKLFHRYLHMNTVEVSVGQKVAEGQRIGTVGNTGTQYAHLHLDIWTDRNGLGVHWNYDKDTELASYEDSFWLIQNNLGWTGNKLEANQRIVVPEGVRQRTEPNTSSSIVTTFAGGEILTFNGWKHGETVEGSSVWFRGAFSGYWCHSSGLTNPSTVGLTDLNAPIPPVTPPPVKPPYTFTKDLACVTEVKPAALGNFEYGNFPSSPQKAVIHDFGTLGKDTFSGTVAWFQNPASETSAHFVVSGKNIVQMVSIHDRAYHAGPNGNNFIGIETDPKQDADTIESTKKILTELKAKYGYQLALIEHNQVMNTACGDDVDLKNYDITPEIPLPPDPEKPTDPEVPETGESLWDVIKGWISKLIDWLSSWKRSK